MDITINLLKIQKHGLTPTLYCFLYCLQADIEFPWKLSDSQIKALEESEWLKITNDGLFTRAKFRTTFKKELEGLLASERVEDWITEWRSLWPSKVKSASRPVIGDKQGVLKKMTLFVKENKEYTKQEIFDATKAYLYEKERDSHRYMTCADYFISKDGSSMLASWIETIRLNGHSLLNTERSGGHFHKEI